MFEAKIIADSRHPDGETRLTTMQITFPRPFLAEFNTHRKFSRNSASSRAIPISKRIDAVEDEPYIPEQFAANKKGMQAGEVLTEEEQDMAREYWLKARDDAVAATRALEKLGVHKQWSNRLIEPFSWTTVCVSSTEWQNFFDQRCSPLAQPEMRQIAEMMRDALAASTPVDLDYGQWHLPYVAGDEKQGWEWSFLASISVARCARTSYLTQEGKRDVEEDRELYRRLRQAEPPHWSPFEHVATPMYNPRRRSGNFDGFGQLRQLLEWIPAGMVTDGVLNTLKQLEDEFAPPRPWLSRK